MTERRRAFSALGIDPLEDASPANDANSVVPADVFSGGRRRAFEALGISNDAAPSVAPADSDPRFYLPGTETGVFSNDRGIPLSTIEQEAQERGVSADSLIETTGLRPNVEPVEPETPGFLETLVGLITQQPDSDAFTKGVGDATNMVTPDPFQRGFYRARQASQIGNMDTTDPYAVADALIDTSAQIAEYPMDDDTAAALSAITDPDASWGDIFRTALTTKGGLKAVAAVTGESLVQYAPSLAVGAGTTLLTGNPYAGAVAAFPVSFGVTFNNILLEEMRKRGADPDDPANRDKIAQILQDESFWADARKSAGAYSLPVAAFDSLSFGLAGKFIAPAIQSGRRGAIPAALGAEVAQQGVYGAVGETTGQGGQMLVGARDEFNKGDIALEGLAEIPVGGIETVIQTPAALQQQRAAQQRRQVENLIAAEDVARAYDPTPGQGANINLQLNPRRRAFEAIGLEIPSSEVTATQTPVQTASLDTAPIAPPAPPVVETPEPAPAQPPVVETPAQAPVQPPVVETPAAPIMEQPNPRITNTAAAANKRTITTVDQAESVVARPVIVELEDLKQATGALQPRDRSLAESDSGVRTRAVNLDPRQLGDSPIGDSGAPIILSDGTILSGNGRALTLREVYNDQDLVQQRISYKSFLRDYVENYKTQSEPIGDRQAGKLSADIANMKQPVLVMQIEGDIDTDTAVRFVQGNNLDRTAQMGATEQAQLDADRITDDMLRSYRGGEIESRENKQFLDAFARDIVAENERGAFSRDGRLTKEGAQRIEAAILAKTYKDTGVLSNMLESRDDNIRNITSAMLGASPAFAQLQGEIAAGRIEADYDITPAVVEVAKTISQLRLEGVKVQDFLAQQDAFTELDPLVEALIVAFYDGNRALSAKKLTQVLEFYIEEAQQKEAGGFFEDTTTAQDIVQLARGKVDRGERTGDGNQVSFLDQSAQRDEAQPVQSRQETTRPTDAERSPDTASGREQTVERNQKELGRKVARPGRADEIIDTRQRSAGKFEEVEQSVLGDVFVMAGLNPDTAMNLPPKRQIKVITDTFEQRFGIKVFVKDSANVKNVINKLMDGYVAFENMAHALQMPPSVIGLNGTLRFYLDGNLPAPGALAYYSNQTKEIHQVVESNSFAHEWFHALDYWIQDSYGTSDIVILDKETAEENRGQSARVRKARKETKPFQDAAPVEVKEAFERLIRTLYVDAAPEAAKIMQLEQEIARLEAKQRETGKQYKALEAAQTRLNSILEGRSSVRLPRSRMNEKTKGDEYYNRPTEMFARAGETFIGRQLEVLGSNSQIVAPGDNYYDVLAKDFMGDDPARIDAIYPQAEDRLRVFGAYADLMQALYETGDFGQKNAFDTGVETTVLDPMGAWRSTPDRYKGSLLERTFKEINRENMQRKNAEEVKLRKAPKIEHNKPLTLKVWEKYDALVGGIGIATKDGHILSISGRYKDNKMMQDIRRMVSYNPGGMDGTVTGGTVYDKTQQRMNEYTAKLAQIVRQYELDALPLPVQDILRDFLTGQEETIDLAIKYEGADYNLSRPARELRQLLDQIYTYLRKAEVDVGYLREGGYLPRMLDDETIFVNEADFKKDAGRAYEIVFTNEIGEFDGSVEQFQEIMERLEPKTRALLDEEILEQIDDLRKALQDPEIDALPNDVLNEIYDAVKAAEAEARANQWYVAIGMSMSGDTMTGTVAANFTKQRTLPPEADQILKRYYIDNPIMAIQNYILGATRKAEFNRAFGLHRIPKGDGKVEYNDYLDYAREKLIEQGVSKDDVREFILTVRKAVGQNTYGFDRNSWQALTSDYLAAGVTIPLLGAATISSIAEPFTTAFQTGRVRDGVASFYYTLNQIWTSSRWLSEREKFETLDQVARIMGSAQDFQFGDIITNRLGGGYLSNSSVNGMVTKFFIGNFLGPMTNAQRRAQIQVFTKFFFEIASDFKKFENDTSEYARSKLNRHKRMLQDFGVNEDALNEFVEYVIAINTTDGEIKYRIPTVDDLVNETGAIEGIASVYVNAVSRAARISIQDPQPGVRPLVAEHPTGRVIFAITSFIAAFQRNVLIKSAKSIVRDAADNGKLRATQYAFLRIGLPAAMLYAGHLAISTLREAVLNEERWEEKEDEGELISYLLNLGVSRAGYYGMFDPLVNGIYGLKYQRDLANSVIGAFSYYLTSGAKQLNAIFNDNPNSLYDEYQGWQGVYEMFAVPAMSFGFAALPAPQGIKQTTFYPALLHLRSPDAKREFAQWWVEVFNGQRYVPRDEQGRGRRKRKRRQSRDGR